MRPGKVPRSLKGSEPCIGISQGIQKHGNLPDVVQYSGHKMLRLRAVALILSLIHILRLVPLDRKGLPAPPGLQVRQELLAPLARRVKPDPQVPPARQALKALLDLPDPPLLSM